jgi:hypothetical protein
MRKTKIGVMDFHGSVDITDPCYDKDVWCRMNNVKISEGEYACYVWRHTDKGKYEDGTPYAARQNGLISYVQYVPNGCVYFTDAALQEYVAKCTKRAKPADNNLTYRKQHRPKKK